MENPSLRGSVRPPEAISAPMRDCSLAPSASTVSSQITLLAKTRNGEFMKIKITSIDEYMATFPQDRQKILEELRRAIKGAAPEAGEIISYNMPAFTLNGKYLISFAGWKNHISIYPIPTGSESFNKQVAKYVAGKGTLQFPIDKPLPLKLITKIVQLKVAENRKTMDKKKY
jgi:uncharacterized protein YdhG (YjbR/CyaY superfamily)